MSRAQTPHPLQSFSFIFNSYLKETEHEKYERKKLTNIQRINLRGDVVIFWLEFRLGFAIQEI